MPDNRETLQVNQPNIINLPENNWPDPLVDPSNKLKMVITKGGNGEQTYKDLVSTSQQDQGAHHLPEGHKEFVATVGRNVDEDAMKRGMNRPFDTTVMVNDTLSTPESE